MISVTEALQRLFALVTPMGAETVPLDQASSRVMVTDAVARRTQPPFPASAMDGYAVRAADAIERAVLPVVGESAAGHRFTDALPPASAVRIFTGAPVPDGADSILIQENATREGDQITVTEAPTKGEYVRPAGGDFEAGQTLDAPRRLTPRDVALLAAMNIADVTVSRRPKVALIPTGDELVLPGENPGPDQIISSNNYGLAAALAAIGADPVLCPIARDTKASLETAFDHAKEADFIITLGGASVGDHDLVAEVSQSRGMALEFYKIAMRPGKPLMAGRMGKSVMIGLPGNPVSAIVCGEVFVRPAIDAALGLPAKPRLTSTAPLAHDLEKNGPREHYMRAVLNDEGQIEVFNRQDSSLVHILAQANALVVREKLAENLPKGAIVPFIPL